MFVTVQKHQMTPKDMGRCTVHEETNRVVQDKVILSECFIAEMDFAKHLFSCLDNHGTDLTLEEMLKMKDLTDKIARLLSKV
jgi:hypothetical protein